MSNNKAFKVKNGLDLGEYSKAISDTAVDIFVYDTRKDSDGGAWRKRTQHTSWYNETLNTATRGSRKEFPAVAVIVAETTTITIYDGDDPDLPMWMVFNSNVSTYSGLRYQGRGTNAITAVNGILYTANGTTDGVYYADFLKDHTWRIHTSNWYGPVAKTLAGRNEAIPTSEVPVQTREGLVQFNANDIAATVLPNAPIDAATGLPVPTIAVATDGGVSVIKDDGTVVDITGTSQGSDMPIDQISFVGNHSVMFSHRYASEVSTIPSSDSTAAYYNQVPTFTGRITNSISHDDDTHLAALSSDNNIESIAIDADNAVSKSVSGVSRHNHFAIAGDTDRASAFITSDYNTGWMNGDIKLATLSDTDDTDVTGSELVTNGTFDSNITGWTASDPGCSLSLVSNQLRITNNDATAGGATTPISVVAGKTYTFSVGTSSNDVQLFLGATPNTATYFGPLIANSTTWTSTVTNTVYLMIKNTSTTNGATIDIDNVSVRLAEEDRSVNGNGLQVFGTVTKNPVATGADLVAYGPFSSNNGLIQPYNSDLDFGTDDFSISVWHKGTVANDYILARRTPASNAMFVFIHSSGTVQFFHGSASEIGSTSIITGEWTHICCLRRSGRAYVYVNGVEDATGTSNGSVTLADAELGVGLRPDSLGTALSGGSLALLRISATAPSPEQIAKIYEDEKVLFQENAQATLYGSSDAVTALAYDDSTNLLHVGTSAGRSVFQGLRRVDNTTTAVGAAISASNGLVADE